MSLGGVSTGISYGLWSGLGLGLGLGLVSSMMKNTTMEDRYRAFVVVNENGLCGRPGVPRGPLRRAAPRPYYSLCAAAAPRAGRLFYVLLCTRRRGLNSLLSIDWFRLGWNMSLMYYAWRTMTPRRRGLLTLKSLD